MKIVFVTNESQRKRFERQNDQTPIVWDSKEDSLIFSNDQISSVRFFDPLGQKHGLPNLFKSLNSYSALTVPSHLFSRVLTEASFENLTWLRVDCTEMQKSVEIGSDFLSQSLKSLNIDEKLNIKFNQSSVPNLEMLDIPIRNKDLVKEVIKFRALKCLMLSRIKSFEVVKEILEHVQVNELTIKTSTFEKMSSVPKIQLSNLTLIDMPKLTDISEFISSIESECQLKVSFCPKLNYRK